jgi:hypothetical protein
MASTSLLKRGSRHARKLPAFFLPLSIHLSNSLLGDSPPPCVPSLSLSSSARLFIQRVFVTFFSCGMLRMKEKKWKRKKNSVHAIPSAPSQKTFHCAFLDQFVYVCQDEMHDGRANIGNE